MVHRNETDYRFLFSVVAWVSVANRLWGGLENQRYSVNIRVRIQDMDVIFFLHADKEIIKHTWTKFTGEKGLLEWLM